MIKEEILQSGEAAKSREIPELSCSSGGQHPPGKGLAPQGGLWVDGRPGGNSEIAMEEPKQASWC